MKLVVRTLIFHLFCIISFAYLYLYLSENFDSYITSNNTKKTKTYLDYFLLSTTIQAGVGISDLYPITNLSKIIVIIQQFLMLMTHIITLYIFTI